MENNQNASKKLSVLSLIGIICAGVSLIFAILGTTFTCACSASKTVNTAAMIGEKYKMSAMLVFSILAVIIAIAGIVLAIIALAKNRADKVAVLALIVAGVAFIYALLPMLTICSYNCSLNNSHKALYQSLFK